MKISIKTKLRPLALRVDTSATAQAIGAEMLAHWQATTRAGRQPDGAALPRNRKGQALGVGAGSLLQGWRVEVARSARGSTTVIAKPSARGRQLVAIRVMMSRGVRYQGLNGISERAWRAAIARHASRALR